MNAPDARALFRDAFRRCAADPELVPIVLLVKGNTAVCLSPVDLADAALILQQAARSFADPALHIAGAAEVH